MRCIFFDTLAFSNIYRNINNENTTAICAHNDKAHKGRYTRGSLLLKHSPETRSRVSTPVSTYEGHDEGAEGWNRLGPIKPIWLANWRHIMSRQANFNTHQGACSWNRLVQQIYPWSYKQLQKGWDIQSKFHLFLLKPYFQSQRLSCPFPSFQCWYPLVSMLDQDENKFAWGERGLGCADLNVTHYRVLDCECLNSFCNCL